MKVKWFQFGLACLLSWPSAQVLSQVSKQVPVASVQPFPMDESYIRSYLQNGSASIHLPSGKSCGLNLDLSQSVTALDASIQSIATPVELNNLCSMGGAQPRIFVVRQISYCNRPDGLNHILGCTIATCAVVAADVLKKERPNLFLHEYGHTKTLQDISSPGALMLRALAPNQFEVTVPQCNKLLTSDQEKSVQAMDGAPVLGENDEAIESFINKIYIHGVPLERARAYTATDVKSIVAMLDDQSKMDIWPNILLLMGVAGGADNFAEKFLIGFIQQKYPATTQESYSGTLNALLALGYLVRRTSSESALQFLEASSEPDGWEKTKDFFGGDRQLFELSKYAILSLGESKSAKAREFLKSHVLKKKGFFERPEVQVIIQRALAINSDD